MTTETSPDPTSERPAAARTRPTPGAIARTIVDRYAVFVAWAAIIVVFGILVGLSAAMYLRSRRSPVDHQNVNDDWDRGVAPAAPDLAAADPVAPPPTGPQPV